MQAIGHARAFAGGLPAAQFVDLFGYTPRAIERLLQDDVTVIIQLEEPSLVEMRLLSSEAGQQPAVASLATHRRSLAAAQNAVMAEAIPLGALEISRYDTVYNGIQARVPAGRLTELAAIPGVAHVWRAPMHTPALTRSVPLIGAAALQQELGLDGDGLVIAVIDTGIDYTHAALGGSGLVADYTGNNPDIIEPGTFPTLKVIGGYDLAGTSYNASSTDPAAYIPRPDSDPLDQWGHGTHVASIAAGIGSSSIGPGVAPDATLMAYKVFGRTGSSSLIMDALEMATESYLDNGYPQVINMSLGEPWGTAHELNPDVVATERANAAGIVVVASAGNDGNVAYITGSPAVASGAISVGATISSLTVDGVSDTIASFSSRGPRSYDSALKPEISAPGYSIYAARMGSGTSGTSMSGTSMAAPHVAGVAALVRQAHPDWTPQLVKAAIMNTGVDLTDETVLPRAGAGRVDAYAAATSEILLTADDRLVSWSPGVLYGDEAQLTARGEVTVHNLGESAATVALAAGLQAGSDWAGPLSLGVSPAQVDVPAGGIETAQIEIALDATTVPNGYLGNPEEYYGYITAEEVPRPAGSGAGTLRRARLPFYLQAKPYARLQITGDTTIARVSIDSAHLQITHSGAIPSSLWAYPALVATEQADRAVLPLASLRLLGIDYAWSDAEAGDLIGVAIQTWAPWAVPQPYHAEFDLYLDVDMDGADDYVLFNANYGSLMGSQDNNTWWLGLVDVGTEEITLASPYGIYTDYNSALMEWILPASELGLDRDNARFGYRLESLDAYSAVPSITPAGRTDYWNAPLLWDYDTATPGPDAPVANWTVRIPSAAGYDPASPAGLMVLDYYGDPTGGGGAQAYLAPLALKYRYLTLLPVIAGGTLP